jgi:hypothetical protein
MDGDDIFSFPAQGSQPGDDGEVMNGTLKPPRSRSGAQAGAAAVRAGGGSGAQRAPRSACALLSVQGLAPRSCGSDVSPPPRPPPPPLPCARQQQRAGTTRATATAAAGLTIRTRRAAAPQQRGGARPWPGPGPSPRPSAPPSGRGPGPRSRRWGARLGSSWLARLFFKCMHPAGHLVEGPCASRRLGTRNAAARAPLSRTGRPAVPPAPKSQPCTPRACPSCPRSRSLRSRRTADQCRGRRPKRTQMRSR